MTTAEMMFSPVGELASERKQEAHKVLWALLGAILIHLLVGFALAFLGGFRPAIAPVEDKPVELTIMNPVPVPAKPKNTMFMETDPSRQTAEAPKEKTFESNANSIAASEQPAQGGLLPLPSQQGKDRPELNLKTQDYSGQSQGAAAQPSIAPRQTPLPSAAPTVAPTPAAEQLAMLTAKPTPPPQAQATPAPQQPLASAYRPQMQQTRVTGTISNRGISSVNAFGTPLGRYQKIVTDAIGSRWYAYTRSRADLLEIGTLRAHFFIDRTGQIKQLKVLGNTSNEAFANVCVESIVEAKLPPIPDDVADTLPPEGLEYEPTFTMYPN
jgi:hypothetical protein